LSTAAPSNLEIAAPFLITAGLTILGSLGGLLVIARMEKEYEALFAEAALPSESLTIDMRPKSLAEITNWAIDGATFVGSLLGPGIGLLLLNSDLGVATILIYFAVMLVGFGGFFVFVAKVPVRGYPNRPLGVRVGRWLVGPRRVGPFTPVAVLAVLANAAGALWVLIAGP
jgi:hypothetical protein